MSNKQQTAVESLKEFFKQYDLAHSSLDYYEFKIPMNIFDKKFQESKELEKEQIINARQSHPIQMKKSGWMVDISDGEEYYNETYGNPSTP
jgi:hypothetical protein